MNGVGSRARRYLADAARGFERAPVEVALSLFIAVTYSYSLEAGGEAMRAWLETAVAAGLVLAFAWSGTLLRALGVWSERTRWVVTAAGALLVAAYAWLVQDFSEAAEGWRAAGLVAAAVLMLLALPAFGSSEPVEGMRRVDGRILLRLLAVVLYGLALFAGLALALAAIDTLFELDLDGEIYGHVFGWIFFVLVPWVVFGGLDDYVRPATGAEAVASAVQRLTLYLVPPLLALYFLILYAYMVRIALTGEVPKNLVSPMVLAASGLTALALLLFDPQPRTAGFARALRLAPSLLLPLAPLGAWALFLRIQQYGWTEFRALRLILLAGFTALALGATVQLLRRRPFALHVMPVALAVVLLLAVLGPWSVLPLSRLSQQARLEAALARVGQFPLDTVSAAPGSPARGSLVAVAPAPRPVSRPAGQGPAGGAERVRTVPGELYDQVQTDARYLHTHFGVAALPPRLARLVDSEERWVDFAAGLGLRRGASRMREGAEQVYGRLPGDVPVSVSGGTLYRIELAPERDHPRGIASVSEDSLRLVVRLPGGALTGDLRPLADATGGLRGDLPPAATVVPMRAATGGVMGELVVLEASFEQEHGVRRLRHLMGTLLLPDSSRR